MNEAQSTGRRAQCKGHGAQGMGHGAWGMGHRAQGTGHRAQGTGHGAQGKSSQQPAASSQLPVASRQSPAASSQQPAANSQKPEASRQLIIVSAPSGAGKTTIVRHLLSKPYNLEFSVSATSRNPRENEKEGMDYYFLSEGVFKEKIDRQEFLEWEEVYPGIFYGTLKSEVEKILDNGKNVIFDVDVKGGLNIKNYFGDRALAVFVAPPSVETLRERLRKRSTETDEKMAVRLAKAEFEMGFAPQFDVILVNDQLDVARREAETIVEKFLAQSKGH